MVRSQSALLTRLAPMERGKSKFGWAYWNVKKGRARGFEPPYSGATSRCLNHLATPAVV